MNLTLPVTLLVEGLLVLAYCLWRDKPIWPVLLTSMGGNLITQSLLWLVLNLFFSSYLSVLFTAEVLIWLFEAFLLYYLPANRLSLRQAVLLSLGMNVASLASGWFLAV